MKAKPVRGCAGSGAWEFPRQHGDASDIRKERWVLTIHIIQYAYILAYLYHTYLSIVCIYKNDCIKVKTRVEMIERN